MGVKCPKCQTNNSETQKYCGECGAQLKPAQAETRTLRTTDNDSTIGEIISEKYKLLEELGSGGMGVVYKAEQIEPIKRRVALKIIKLGMDTKQVVARFEAEQQSLAVMDHPNIAKVYDAGSTEKGRPFFAMELVHGIPITEYCDKHNLTIHERLELFIPLCQAVQHAHQKGVIHRDLKPSNVLVAVQEDKPVSKIIDFGIAKATEHRLTERTLFTEQGQLIGTPEYMSPEQAEMSGLDVDTRTDIYSLGVMLYELLVGVLPFDQKTFRKAGFGEIQRIIRETEPPKASTRLSGLGDTQTSIAEQRKTDIASLSRELKGDLDWIAMKAMEKDRTRRYYSASDLAADIIRHLNKEPIIARPPSRIYNVGKFIRRHKFGVAMATLLILAVLIGGIAATIGFVRATKAELLAKQEAQTAKQTSNFLEELFKVSDPGEARGNTITAREILDKGAEDIEKKLTDQPAVQARLMGTMGRVYTSLGLYKKAEPLLEKAVKTQRQLLGVDHPDTLISINDLANLYWYLGRFSDAEPLYLELVEARNRVLGSEHPDTLRANWDLASLYYMQKRQEEAEQLTIKILEIQRRVLGNEHPDTAASMHNLGSMYWGAKKYQDALPLLKEALEIRSRVLGEVHPTTIITLRELALTHDRLGNSDRAGKLFIEVLELSRRVWGDEHPSTIRSMSLLSGWYLKNELYEKAEPLLLNIYRVLKNKPEEQRGYMKETIERLILVYTTLGKPEKADEYRALLKENEIKK